MEEKQQHIADTKDLMALAGGVISHWSRKLERQVSKLSELAEYAPETDDPQNAEAELECAIGTILDEYIHPALALLEKYSTAQE